MCHDQRDRWRRGAIGSVLDERSRARRFSPRQFRCHSSDARQVVHTHTHVPLFTRQYKLAPAKDGDALKLGR